MLDKATNDKNARKQKYLESVAAMSRSIQVNDHI